MKVVTRIHTQEMREILTNMITKVSLLLSNLRFKIDGQKSITGGGDDEGCEGKPHCRDREHGAHRDLGQRLLGLNLGCFHLVLLLPVLVAELLISVDVNIFFIL